ncbi:Matrix metalloproteinase-17 [Xylographa vitiligo]|nr:Matrix metalloproteinase-17 [Xylographa vitiligo]
MIDYFFSGNQYIQVSRGDTAPGTIAPGFPAPITNWGWGDFGLNGIDAALFTGSKCFFFKDAVYIRVTRGVLDTGTVDEGFPRPISDWGWGSFGARGIDAAMWSGDVLFFFKGNEYIKVRGADDTHFGTIDPGYPAPIKNWLWGFFGASGINAALYSGSKNYFFSGNQYLQTSRGMEGAGLLDKGFPKALSDWGWGSFGASGIDAALNSDGPLVPPPSGGFRGNSNYFMHANEAELNGVGITIHVDTQLASSKHGWSFQLNCWSVRGSLFSTQWQQYVIYSAGADDSNVNVSIDSWFDDLSEQDQVINTHNRLGSMSHIAITAGYIFQIFPHFDDQSRIVACRFIMTDEKGKTRGDKTINIIGQPHAKKKGKATIADCAPIAFMSVDIGGEYNGQLANFNTGAGTVTYTANQSLVASPSFPPEPTDFDAGTAESGNIIFGQLPQTANTTISQLFQVPLIPPKPAVGLAVDKARMPAKRFARPPLPAQLGDEEL